MNIRLRITMGFFLIVFIMAIVSGIIIWQQAKMQVAFQNSFLIGDLNRYLLECRRQEKNYLLRKDQESLELFQTNFELLMSSTSITSTTINEKIILDELQVLNNKLKSYQSQFEQLVLYYEIEDYRDEFNEANRLCIKFARDCHDIIKNIRVITENQFNNALSISSIVNTFAVIIGVFISIVVSSFIADRVLDLIGTPKGELTKYLFKKKRDR